MKRVNDSNTIGGLGCMICGAEDIQIYVTLNDRIAPDSSFADLMKTFDPLPREAVHYGLHYEPLETYHQALWRVPPEIYFTCFPEYPLLDRPLLCLCEVCSDTVVETHEWCDVSDQEKPIVLLEDDRFRLF